ncbi:MAG: hypothetical protein U9N49_12635 [Campylobacterota bacterium]|nr:hypothetical protein [Campylobacterota bacterium]
MQKYFTLLLFSLLFLNNCTDLGTRDTGSYLPERFISNLAKDKYDNLYLVREHNDNCQLELMKFNTDTYIWEGIQNIQLNQSDLLCYLNHFIIGDKYQDHNNKLYLYNYLHNKVNVIDRENSTQQESIELKNGEHFINPQYSIYYHLINQTMHVKEHNLTTNQYYTLYTFPSIEIINHELSIEDNISDFNMTCRPIQQRVGEWNYQDHSCKLYINLQTVTSTNNYAYEKLYQFIITKNQNLWHIDFENNEVYDTLFSYHYYDGQIYDNQLTPLTLLKSKYPNYQQFINAYDYLYFDNNNLHRFYIQGQVGDRNIIYEYYTQGDQDSPKATQTFYYKKN